MDLGLQGKNIVITGGSRGIGLACAQVFVQENASVTVIGRTEENLDNAKKVIGNVNTFASDLSNNEGIERAREIVQKADVLVNNAGEIPGGSLESLDESTWRQAWELKVYGYLRLSKMALPFMRERNSGVIVNVIGIAGQRPSNDYLCGSMANAALIAFTKSLGASTTKDGVRVVGVNPGPTETDRLKYLYQMRAQELYGDANRWLEILSDLPFNRPSKPTEIANIVAFLASEKASYLSGLVIDADGGNSFK